MVILMMVNRNKVKQKVEHQKLANGDSYDGEWKEGKPEGRGIYKSKNGGIHDQERKNGKIKSSMMHSNARIL